MEKMADSEAKKDKKSLWILIEEKILEHGLATLSAGDLEATIQKTAKELDETGHNVSRLGGNMIKLRFAVDKARKAGKALLEEFNAAISSLTLDDVTDPYGATTKILDGMGSTWPDMKDPDRRPDVIAIVERTRLDLMIAKAKEMPDDKGIRYLIENEINFGVISTGLGITDEKVNEVNEQIKKERAEIARVKGLVEKVADKSNEEKVRHLIDNNVAEALMIEIAGVSQGDIDGAKKAMEEELKEKQRLAEEEAARKKAEAEGPALEDISNEDMIDFIDSIREIMEFSDQEKEIRVMCEQSSIPKALVDIAVSEPDKLDELEKKAEG
jgi:hypothetical protein